MPRSLAPSPTTSVSMLSRSKDSRSSISVASLAARRQDRFSDLAGQLAILVFNSLARFSLKSDHRATALVTM